MRRGFARLGRREVDVAVRAPQRRAGCPPCGSRWRARRSAGPAHRSTAPRRGGARPPRRCRRAGPRSAQPSTRCTSSIPSSPMSTRYPRRMPWFASLPGFTHTVLPMLPLAAGLVDVPVHARAAGAPRSRAARPSSRPGRAARRRPRWWGAGSRRGSAPCRGRSRSGGTWIMKIARRGSATWSASASSRSVQLVLGHLARRLPRRRVRPAVRQQLEPAGHVEHLPVGVDRRELGAVEDRVDREVVVVSRDQVERHSSRRGARSRARIHASMRSFISRCSSSSRPGIVAQPLGLVAVGRRTSRSRRRRCRARAARARPRRAPAAARRAARPRSRRRRDDRHDRLARQVARDQARRRPCRRSA